MRIDKQGVSSEKMSQHIKFLEDELLHAISELCVRIVPCC